ncbi:MAG: chromosome partitioning protein ParB [Dehalococcoidia bacterium]|nr:chromosome partitioning protein ParB [Dehalococcoidia bacterium]
MTIKTKTVTERAVEALIPLDKLKKSPRNARTTPHTEAAIEALAASINVKGMLQNLVVEPERDAKGAETGWYYVTAGEGRRLAQLLRVKRRQVKKTEPIRCVVDDTNDPHEVSLDENVTRSAMHPADQFEAFKRLGDEQGWGAEEIGARFGVTAQVVRQRLRLGAVSPRLMQRYREGELTLDQLMAFAISEDHARQEQVYDTLNTGWGRDPRTIRQRMMETHVDATDRRAIFVGVDAYAEAGGAVVRDLFSEDGGGYLEDGALLDRLALEKLSGVAADVQAEGWKWAEAYLDFPYDHGLRRSYPRQVDLPAKDRKRLDALRAQYDELYEQYEGEEDEELPEDLDARIEQLEGEIEQLAERQRVYDPEMVARAGVFVTLDRDGRARVERGYIRPEDEQEHDGPDAGNDLDGADDDSPSAGAGDDLSAAQDSDSTEDAREGKPLPDLLVRDLTAHRTLGLRLALGEQPGVALIAVTHALAAQAFYHVGDETCLEIRATDTPLRGHAAGIDDTSAAQALAARHEAWAAQMPSEVEDLWAFVTSLDDERRMSLFAHCAAATVFAVRLRWDRRSSVLEGADRLAEAVSLDMTAHWQPTANAYLGRVTKAQIAQAVREGVSDEEAERIASMKKQPMADAAERLLAGTGWLPALLRTSQVDGAELGEAFPEAT